MFLKASSTKLLITGKHGYMTSLCMCMQMDVTSNTYCDLATQPALFRTTHTTEKNRQ